MTFVSYAQNYEDVMLWRALKHIENGFYIDVGAAWPSEHSVTKLFYDEGWRGINIEPNLEFSDQYEDERKEDINLPVAVSDAVGEIEMFFIQNTGLSTLNQEIAKDHSKVGWKTTPRTVEVRTLTDICEEYCVDQEIHFLKVDIEGFEEQALKGNDWSKFRPWVIVVEATLPMSQVENYEKWEPILSDANYIFAYADGLNRFYVSNEHKELLPAFKYPPNVFDEFRTTLEVDAENKVMQAESKTHDFWEKAVAAEAAKEQLQERMQTLEHQAQEQAENVIRAREQKVAAEAAKVQLQQTVLTLEQQLGSQASRLEGLIAEKNEQQEQAQLQTQRLQDELDVAKAKVDELNHSSHYWWLQSEQLNEELQTIYNSKSWKITWPLRKLMQFYNWLFYFPITLILWVIRLPKRAVRYLLVKLMTYVLKRPSLKFRVRRLLSKYPRVEAKLRDLAAARGLLFVREAKPIMQTIEPIDREEKVTEPDIEQPESAALMKNEGVALDENLSRLTHRARCFYKKMKVTAMQQERESR